MRALLMTVLSFQAIYCDWSQDPREVNYFFKRTECNEFNPKFIDHLNCSHKFGSHFQKYSSMEFTIHPGVLLDKIYLELLTYKKFRTVYRPSLIKVKENFCDMVGNKSNSYFAKQMRKLLSGYITNLNQPCPLQGKKYKKDNVEHNGTHAILSLPPLIPLGDWKFVHKFTTLMNGPEEFLIKLTDVYEVTQKSATQF